MSANVIIVLTFMVVLLIAISEAITIYFVLEKGRNIRLALVLGLLPLVGQIIASFLKETDKELFDKLYNRNLISKTDYLTLTTEIDLTKKPK